MNKLIVNADDFGYSRGINHAIIDAHKEGIITSTSLMTNAPGFEHAVKLAKKNPTLGIGVHLVLTFLEPLSQDVPSLVDENGSFYRPEAYRQGFALADSEELYKEWDRQIQKVLATGLQPDHLNAHHHIQTFNEYHTDVFLDLAEKYQLPVRRNLETERTYKTTSYYEPSFDAISSLDKVEQDYFLDSLFEKILENDSTEIMNHPAYIDETLFMTSAFVEPRIYMAQMLTESAFVDRIKADKRIELITYAEL